MIRKFLCSHAGSHKCFTLQNHWGACMSTVSHLVDRPKSESKIHYTHTHLTEAQADNKLDCVLRRLRCVRSGVFSFRDT